MARVSKEAVRQQGHEHFESFLRTRSQAILLDKWIKGRQYDIDDLTGQPWRPNNATDEHDDLASRAPEPWAGLIVTSLAQTAYVDGIRAPGSSDNMEVWETFERNSWARRQIAIHRDAIGHGAAYGTVMPGTDPLTGDRMAKMRGKSSKQMAAFYGDDDDEWCLFALEGRPFAGRDGASGGWYVDIYDEVAVHHLVVEGEGLELKNWTYLDYTEHPFRVPPVVRFANRLDNEGRVLGEVAPVLPLLRSIDQDKFDRLIVQRFGAWKVRYIAGMAKPSSKTEQNYQAMRLKVEDLLISSDPTTKFGTLDATDLKGFIEAHDADLRVLSAVTQIPPHHLLGLSSNLQAEALAAAESSLQRKSGDFRTLAGEGHEQMARLVAIANGNLAEAKMVNAQVRWRDTESRSLQQAADGLFKLASGLKVPVEMLWERIPGWTDSDSERAKTLIESGAVEALLAALAETSAGDDASGVEREQGAQGGNAAAGG